MAEPSSAAFGISDYFADTPNNDSWNSAIPKDNHGLTTPVGVSHDDELQTPRVEPLLFSDTPLAGAQYDGGSGWSSSDNSGPISTPSAAVDPPPPISNSVQLPPLQNNGQNMNRWYTNIDGANAAATSYPYVAGTLNQYPIIMNAMPIGHFNLDHYAAAYPKFPTQCHFNPPPYHPHPMPPYSAEHSFFHGGPTHSYGSISGQPNQYRPTFDDISGRMDTPASALDCRNVPKPMGEHLAVLQRPSLLKKLLTSPAIPINLVATPRVEDKQPSKPSCGAGMNEETATTTLESHLSSMASCYPCGRRYPNQEAYHDHWLRVHVLQTRERPLIEKKRKRIHSLSTMSNHLSAKTGGSYNSSCTVVSSNVVDQAKMATEGSGNDASQNPSQVDDIMAAVAEFRHGETIPADSENQGSVSTMAESGAQTEVQSGTQATSVILSSGNQSQFSAMPHPDVDFMAEISLRPIDLSVKPNNGQANKDKGSDMTKGQLHEQPLRPNILLMDGRTVEPMPNTTAECPTFRSSVGSMSVVVPQGVLEGAGNAFPEEAESTNESETSGQNDDDKPAKVYKCVTCSNVYRSRRSLNKHVRLHHDPNPQPQPLKSMYEDIDKMEKNPLPCGKCPKRFVTQKSRNQHWTYHLKGELR